MAEAAETTGAGVQVADESATRRDEFVGRLFQMGLAAGELTTVLLGDRLGLYRALAEHGPLHANGLAQQAAVDARYAREWLEQQAVAGILTVDDAGADEQARKYALPVEHSEALLDRDSPAYIGALPRLISTVFGQIPTLQEAFRWGSGVAYSAYGKDAVEGQADLNRPMYIHQLGQEWLPALSDVHQRLSGQPAARVADIGCGAGWSGIAMARAYPGITVDGFDSDPSSIELARSNVAEAGLSDRIRIHRHDASDPNLPGTYDLVTFFEMVHDMSRPVEALGAARLSLAPGGTALVFDERVAEAFTAPGDEVERFMYVSSVLFCLPTSRAELPSAATGTAMRPATLRRYALEAGFIDVETTEIGSPFQRFYRLIA